MRKASLTSLFDKIRGKKNGADSPESHSIKDEEESTQNNRPRNLINLFAIGNGGVGKTTIIKQMCKLSLTQPEDYTLYDDNWTRNEADRRSPLARVDRLDYVPIVHHNVLKSAAVLCQGVFELGPSLSNGWLEEGDEQLARSILDYVDDHNNVHHTQKRVDRAIAETIVKLWEPAASPLRQVLHRPQLQVPDSTEYFFKRDKLLEMASPGYHPSYDDVIRVRNPTAGPHKYNFRIHNTKFSIMDTGGQKVEKARLPTYLSDWLHQTEPGDRNYILFVASMADYNVPHPKRPGYTNLDASAALLQLVMSQPMLENIDVIVFLNKYDVFEEKVKSLKDMPKYYPKYWQAAVDQMCSSSQPQHTAGSRRAKLQKTHSVQHSNGTDQSGNVELAQSVVNTLFTNAVNEATRLTAAAALSHNTGSESSFYYKHTTAVDTNHMDGIFGIVIDDLRNERIRRMDQLSAHKRKH